MEDSARTGFRLIHNDTGPHSILVTTVLDPVDSPAAELAQYA